MKHPTRRHSAENRHRDKGKEQDRKLYKRWEVWAVIALMLAAMVFYIVSLDESIWPGAKQGNKSPAQTTAPSKP